MTWFYKEGRQEIGPIGKSQLQELIHARRINGQTLVRSTAMTDWRPLAEMVGAKQTADITPASPTEIAPAAATANAPPAPEAGVLRTESVVCSQCKRTFPKEQVVRFDNQVICAACKPLFVQRLKEGVAIGGILKYAGFWVRFGAKCIDYLILGVTHMIIVVAMSFLTSASAPAYVDPADAFSSGALWLLGIQQLIGILIPALYTTFFIGRFGATPGKMACNLKVVAADGGKVSYMRALGRNFAEFISALIMMFGYLMVAFDGEKRALHDRICSTRVVRK
ncbi:MAG: RDD family protein [Desulfatitalea sp.]|nr:RDD family protein [Desulfatitalea sp.]